MKIEKLQVGQTVYMTMRRQMGNTMLKTTSVFPVRIVEINLVGSQAHGDGYPNVLASWNNNPARKYYQSEVSKWKEKKPVLVHSLVGSSRLATKEELKAIADGTFTGRHS